MLYVYFGPCGGLAHRGMLIDLGSGLDNAGKTTIVKKIMNEDVNTVSPTLGFNIKTIDYEGYILNICKLSLSPCHQKTLAITTHSLWVHQGTWEDKRH